MSSNVRAYLVEQLNLPAGWKVIPEQRFPETISATTVILQHTRIEPLPAAPIGHLRHEVTLSVLSPFTDIAKAEDDLDDAVAAIITNLDGHDQISWTAAEKTTHNDSYGAWNITLTVISSKEK